MRELILGTRGSALALWQARYVAQRLRERHPRIVLHERIVKTEGDLQQTAPLGPGDYGVFVRRLEQLMTAGEIDLAVHSLKDMPTTQPAGLVMAAVPPRHDPRDVLLTLEGQTFEALPAGTVIGTGSYRRRSQLLNARPDLATEPIRGTVETRIRTLNEGSHGAIVLALAGLERLGLTATPYRPISVDVCLPAVGQGALGIETREDDDEVRGAVADLDDEASHRAVDAERAFLRTLGGGCLAPATAFATVARGRLWLRAAVGDADGRHLLRDAEEGAVDDALLLGERLAERMIAAGARDLLEAARASAGGADGR